MTLKDKAKKLIELREKGLGYIQDAKGNKSFIASGLITNLILSNQDFMGFAANHAAEIAEAYLELRDAVKPLGDKTIIERCNLEND